MEKKRDTPRDTIDPEHKEDTVEERVRDRCYSSRDHFTGEQIYIDVLTIFKLFKKM